jgi:hypothetical protein
MESTPSKIDDSPEVSDKKDSKKKKKAGSLGTVALKPEGAARDSENTGEKKPGLDKSEADPNSPKSAKKAESASADAETKEMAEVDSLTAEEKQFIEKELIQAAKHEQLEATAETTEDAAAEAAVEDFRERIIEGEDSEDAYVAALESIEVTTENDNDNANEDTPGPLEAPEVPEPSEPTIHEFADDDEISLSSAEDSDAVDTSIPGTPSSGPVTAAGGSGVGGGSRRPPAPPRGPSGPFGGPHGSGFNRFGGPGVPLAAANAPRLNVAPNAAPQAPEQSYDYGNPAAAALVGGIMGYLIGRRRGRIKTEKKLLPVQKKLQQEVVDLQWDIRTKEASLRQAARDKNYLKQQLSLERTSSVTKSQEKNKEQTLPINLTAETSGGKPRQAAAPQERIGHVLVTAEASVLPFMKAKERGLEKNEVPKKAKTEAPVVTKHIEHLNRAELMAISDKIYVEGSSLRQIYENRLVGEKGLRRLVAEHLRGGNIKKALRREIMEREIDFERDPVMRDHPTVAMAAGGRKEHNPALQRLLQKADAALPAHDEEVAYYKARAEYEAKEKQQEQRQQKLLDSALAATIILLMAIILMLIVDKF